MPRHEGVATGYSIRQNATGYLTGRVYRDPRASRDAHCWTSSATTAATRQLAGHKTCAAFTSVRPLFVYRESTGGTLFTHEILPPFGTQERTHDRFSHQRGAVNVYASEFLQTESKFKEGLRESGPDQSKVTMYPYFPSEWQKTVAIFFFH